MAHKIVAVITDMTGDRVAISDEALIKAVNHLNLPEAMLLELLDRVLKDPSDLFWERDELTRRYYFFYRYEQNRYFVAVVKKILTGQFLCTMYTTGKKIKTSTSDWRDLNE